MQLHLSNCVVCVLCAMELSCCTKSIRNIPYECNCTLAIVLLCINYCVCIQSLVFLCAMELSCCTKSIRNEPFHCSFITMSMDTILSPCHIQYTTLLLRILSRAPIVYSSSAENSPQRNVLFSPVCLKIAKILPSPKMCPVV